MTTDTKLATLGFACILILSVLLSASIGIATNTLNIWARSDGYGIAVNDVGGIDETGVFVCPSAPFADMLPQLVVDC